MEEKYHGTTDFRLLRLWDIIGDAERGIQPLLPISKSSWLRGVKDGAFPQPKRLGAKTIVWLASDIYDLIENLPKADVNDQ